MARANLDPAQGRSERGRRLLGRPADRHDHEPHNDKTFDWSSNIGVDAVIVKGGADGTHLYRYDPPTEEKSDTDSQHRA